MSPVELATMLRAWAAGWLPYIAAVELLVAHEHWLRMDAFRSAVTVSAIEGMASIDWELIAARLDSGDVIASSSERGILAIACSIGGGHPVDLRDALLSLDSTNVRLVADAVLAAGGGTPRYPVGPVGLRKLIVDVAAQGDDEDPAGVSIDDVTADRIAAAILARLGGA